MSKLLFKGRVEAVPHPFPCDWTDSSICQSARHHRHTLTAHLHRASLEVEIKNFFDVYSSSLIIWTTRMIHVLK